MLLVLDLLRLYLELFENTLISYMFVFFHVFELDY